VEFILVVNNAVGQDTSEIRGKVGAFNVKIADPFRDAVFLIVAGVVVYPVMMVDTTKIQAGISFCLA
jgi:hypothetical protein